jgi:hypothetical protein
MWASFQLFTKKSTACGGQRPPHAVDFFGNVGQADFKTSVFDGPPNSR